jgi:hypothetical protein
MKVAPKIKKIPFNDRTRVKELIYEVFDDTFRRSYQLIDGVDIMVLRNLELFTLTLTNKKFEFEELNFSDVTDYVDVYLQGILQEPTSYDVTTSGNNIIITFNQAIAYTPSEILISEFMVKGKLVDI